MKKLTFLLIILLVLSFSLTSYGHEGFSSELTKINEKFSLQNEENQRQRNEILRLFNILSPEKAERIPVLLYHHILKEEEIKEFGWENNGSVISEESFKEQMDYLYENDYFTATLDELQGFLDGTIELPKKTVVITFDDGYLSNAVYAYPIMKEYGFKGAIFMRAGMSIHPQKPFSPENTQVISLSEDHKYKDVFEYGCHTYNLHNKDENNMPLLLALSKDEVIADLKKNKEIYNTNYIAFPYGRYNNKTLEYIKDLGYEMGFTVKSGYVSKDSSKLELQRMAISPNTTIEKFKNIVK
ncbi:MAG: polysaccharide deacetylase family protein [Tissierellales bacterium]